GSALLASGGGDATIEGCAGDGCAGALGNIGPAGNEVDSDDFPSGPGSGDARSRGLSSGARDVLTGRGVEGRCFRESRSGATAVGGSSVIHATRGSTVRGPSARRSVRGFHVVTFEPGGHSWELDGKQYVTITSGATGPYVMRAGDPNLANVPAGAASGRSSSSRSMERLSAELAIETGEQDVARVDGGGGFRARPRRVSLVGADRCRKGRGRCDGVRGLLCEL